MPRRILLVGKGESLHRAWRSRSFGLAGADLEKLLHVPAVSVFPSDYCGSGAVGTADDVARRVGVSALRAHGLTGKSVHVAVVDTGIDGSRIPVAGGWAPGSDYVPGSAKPDHGTMVAY